MAIINAREEGGRDSMISQKIFIGYRASVRNFVIQQMS